MSVSRGKALTEALRRAWTAGGGLADGGPVTIDVDSTICEVSGKTKQGAAYGYTNRLGYHPLLAVRADTGEIVAARLRGGASQQGNAHFVAEAVGRVRRAGAAGEITVRADAGFWSHGLIEQLGGLGVRWSITIPLYPNVRAAIEAIPETAWESIEYTETGAAQAAETLIGGPAEPLRLVVRRTRLVGHQAQIWTARGTTPSPPTPICLPSKRTGCTAVTHPLSSLSAISKKAASLTCLRGVQRQRRLACLRGARLQPDPMDQTPRAASNQPGCSPSDAPSESVSTAFPAALSTTEAASCSASPPDGPGPAPTRPSSTTSAPYPNSADPARPPPVNTPP